jgi:hypothetical protein
MEDIERTKTEKNGSQSTENQRQTGEENNEEAAIGQSSAPPQPVAWTQTRY